MTRPWLVRVWRRLIIGEAGAAMIEFAIIAPLLFVLIFGIVDYGRYFYWYSRLSSTARAAARVGSVIPVYAGMELALRDTVLSRLEGTGVTAAMVTVQVPIFGTTTGRSSVQVTISGYPFDQVTPLIPIPEQIPAVTAEYRHEFR